MNIYSLTVETPKSGTVQHVTRARDEVVARGNVGRAYGLNGHELNVTKVESRRAAPADMLRKLGLLIRKKRR